MNFSKASHALRCGAFFFGLLFLGCSERKHAETPDWPTGETPTHENVSPRPATADASHARELSLLVYNVYNYLWMERGSKEDGLKPKPDEQIRDLIEVIVNAEPDILGICEIGTPADLRDLQARLEKHDQLYPHSYLHQGVDPYRRLAILSRLPIKVNASPERQFMMGGKSYQMLRGILDVTVTTDMGPTRLLGIHLKSKRPSPHYDQLQMRRHEAHQVRKHIDQVLGETPRVLVYGDVNDTRRSTTVQAITGTIGTNRHMKPLDITAEDGSKWTHYWSYQDVYSRLDYIFASKAMLQAIDLESCKIIRPPRNNKASDHHPLLLRFK